jgi:hypothetical protein
VRRLKCHPMSKPSTFWPYIGNTCILFGPMIEVKHGDHWPRTGEWSISASRILGRSLSDERPSRVGRMMLARALLSI